MLGLVLGTLRLPLIVAISGSPLAAAGTNIAISAAAAASGAVSHARERRVDWRVVAWMAPPSVVGAVVGAFVADDVPEGPLYFAIAPCSSGAESTWRSGPSAPSHASTSAAVAGRRRRPRDRRARRRSRRDPRNAAHADTRARRRDGCEARRRDEPRGRVSARRRRVRGAFRLGRRRLGTLAAGLAGAHTGRFARRPRDRQDDEDLLRIALGTVLVLVGAVFAAQACSSAAESRRPRLEVESLNRGNTESREPRAPLRQPVPTIL